MDGARVPESVLRAWDVHDLELLPGGQGEAFRSRHLVLKPAPEHDRCSWLADALDGLAPDGSVRITQPQRSIDGRWVVDGWAAWHWLEGEPWTPALDELLAVSARFHAAVAAVPWDPRMGGTDRWAVADRAAWGDEDRQVPGPLERLAAARRPVDLPDQLIHGDLFGNMLWHPSLPPAVIDVSPYWRPAPYADAIALVDRAMRAQDPNVAKPEALGPHGHQLLIRAVLFRALSEPEPPPPCLALAEHLLATRS